MKAIGKKKLGIDISSKITKGSSPSWQGFKYQELGILFVTSENVRDGFLDISKPKYVDNKFLKKQKNSQVLYGDILINIVGASIGRCCIYWHHKQALINQAVAIFRVNDSCSIQFINYCYLQYRIQRIIFGTQSESARPNLSLTDLKNLIFIIPQLKEQEKIASFLDSVTLRISQLRRKRELLETYKKGVMQKIFSQQIRFTQDNGKPFPDWQKKKLGDVFTRITRKNTENNTNVLTISAQYGLINQRDFFNKSVAAKDLTGYYLLKRGDFAYNKSYSNGYPMGAIKRLYLYEKGVVSTLYICFTNSNETEAKFYEQYFDGGFLNRELSKIAQEGARNHGLLNMSVIEFFKDLSIDYPSLEEQEKIANFLTSIDRKIEAVSLQIEKLEEFKQGLLQKMFV